jgi:type IV secretion system protein VirD4
MQTDKVNSAGILPSIICASALGFILASGYTNFQQGITMETLSSVSILAFLYQTPIYQGCITEVFCTGVALIGLTIGVVLIAQGVARAAGKQHHGSAHWVSFAHLRRTGYLQGYRRVRGPIFGKTTGPFWPGRYLTNGDQPHSLVVAPTRAGKGVGVVIPTLLTFKGSVIALDVKGELFDLTSRARLAGGDRVFKFAPLDAAARTHCYNPVLDIVAMPPERQFAEARRLATNLLIAKGKGSEGFLDGARDLFVAGILFCIEQGNPTIGAVYDLFSQPGEKYKLFARLAEESKSKEAQRIFDNMAGNDTKILTSYTSVLGDGGLNLWADPLIKAATSRSDFSVYDLRRRAVTVYLCVSPNDLELLAPLMRLLFQQVVSILQRKMPGKDEPLQVLFLFDEFKHLGKVEAIETAVTTIAGYQGQFMFIVQSLSALTGAYEETGKHNFLSNTGVQVFMATADDETPNYISKAIGDYTFRAKSISFNHSKRFDTTTQYSEQGAPLMRPEQVRLVDDATEIVLIKGKPPLRLPKVKYYADRSLKRVFARQQGPLPEPPPLQLNLAPKPQTAMTSAAVPAPAGLAAVLTPEPAAASLPGKRHPEAPIQAPRVTKAQEAVMRAIEVVGEKNVRAAPPTSPPPAPRNIQALARQRDLLDRIIALQQRNRHHLGADFSRPAWEASEEHRDAS